MNTKQELDSRKEESLKRNLGALVLNALNDKSVIEVMLNDDSNLWVDRLGGGMELIGNISPVQALSIVQTVAGILGTTVTPENPVLECELPLDGSRFEAIIPPLVAKPVFTLRKKAPAGFYPG